LEDEYVKIGLRRMEIATHFNGEKLEPMKKNYQKNYVEQPQVFM